MPPSWWDSGALSSPDARIWREKQRDEALRTQIATDPHSPTEFRCNQIVRNIDAFHEAFGVTEDDPMAAHRCFREVSQALRVAARIVTLATM
jgi:predicted metalloendopeptidase